MKKVKWYEYEQVPGNSDWAKIFQGEAIFHQWGVDYEEFETGPGNYSTAIIELPDGTIKNIPAEMITFNKVIEDGQAKWCPLFEECEFRQEHGCDMKCRYYYPPVT